jgi:hypothetical protein
VVEIVIVQCCCGYELLGIVIRSCHIQDVGTVGKLEDG